jgi:hypothetical protein
MLVHPTSLLPYKPLDPTSRSILQAFFHYNPFRPASLCMLPLAGLVWSLLHPTSLCTLQAFFALQVDPSSSLFALQADPSFKPVRPTNLFLLKPFPHCKPSHPTRAAFSPYSPFCLSRVQTSRSTSSRAAWWRALKECSLFLAVNGTRRPQAEKMMWHHGDSKESESLCYGTT